MQKYETEERVGQGNASELVDVKLWNFEEARAPKPGLLRRSRVARYMNSQ